MRFGMSEPWGETEGQSAEQVSELSIVSTACAGRVLEGEEPVNCGSAASGGHSVGIGIEPHGAVDHREHIEQRLVGLGKL